MNHRSRSQQIKQAGQALRYRIYMRIPGNIFEDTGYPELHLVVKPDCPPHGILISEVFFRGRPG